MHFFHKFLQNSKLRWYLSIFFFILFLLLFISLILNYFFDITSFGAGLFSISFSNIERAINRIYLILIITYLLLPKTRVSISKRHSSLKLAIIYSILLIMPISIILYHYTPENKLLDLIYFGKDYESIALPESHDIIMERHREIGYDGQFYAQLALDPSLKNPQLEIAIDNPRYRARRIGLPFLAYFLGLGRPDYILHIYSILNFIFWILLLIVITRYIGFAKHRDILLAFSLLWTTGTAVSIERSLTDLPSASLCVLAISLKGKWIISMILLCFSGLIKDTSLLSFSAVPWKKDIKYIDIKRSFLSFLVCIFPLVLWMIYINFNISKGSTGGLENFTIPLIDIITKFNNAIIYLRTGIPKARHFQEFFEILAPLSLLIQAIYLLYKPRIKSSAWRLGIGFAFLTFIININVWYEQFAYTRVLLPLTFSFNLLIHKHESKAGYALWFILGNIGMFWLAYNYIY